MEEPPIYPDLKDASVLVTGGATGIGAALVEGFVRQGARVAFVDIARSEGAALAGRLEAEAAHAPLFVEADLADVTALEAAVARAQGDHGPIDVLVNNAARDDRNAVGGYAAAQWDANHAVNLRPHFFTAQAVAGEMKRRRKGAIVNFSSISFMINGADYPVYAAAKAGVIGLTKSLAGALGPHGIRVNAIAPGWVMTERQKKLWVTEEALAGFVERQCLRRAMMPGDLVGPCLFLASEASAMITAQTLIVDGGVM
ncbi:MAG: SDR family NAD(P)-dependent oxidoreductase [Rhizobiaceae bacterium]